MDIWHHLTEHQHQTTSTVSETDQMLVFLLSDMCFSETSVITVTGTVFLCL